MEVSGGSREVTGVCLPCPTVCLSNEPETQGVSLLWRWGDPGRPKVTDLANRGASPFLHPSLLALLSFPLFSTPNLSPSSCLPPMSLVCHARPNEGAHMLNRSHGLLLVLLFSPIFLFLFILDVVWSFPPSSDGSIIFLSPRPPLFACSATEGSLCSQPRCWSLLMLPLRLPVCVCVVCTAFLQPLPTPFPSSVYVPQSARLALKCSWSWAT